MTLKNLTLTAGRSSCVSSRADLDDPTGKRRRHFDISIDSAFTVLNCRATQANTALPQCTGSDESVTEQQQRMSCGCRDAQPLLHGPSGTARPLTSRRGRHPWPQRAPPTPRHPHPRLDKPAQTAQTPKPYSPRSDSEVPGVETRLLAGSLPPADGALSGSTWVR